MSVDAVRDHLRQFGLDHRVKEFDISTATVAEAAATVGVIPARISKTLSFHSQDGCILILMAGDARIDNKKFREQFGYKANMLSPDEALEYTGHAVGGVCPFAVPDTVPVYLDISMRRFETVFPAAGSSSSCVELTCRELEKASNAKAWIDVCKDWDN